MRNADLTVTEAAGRSHGVTGTGARECGQPAVLFVAGGNSSSLGEIVIAGGIKTKGTQAGQRIKTFAVRSELGPGAGPVHGFGYPAAVRCLIRSISKVETVHVYMGPGERFWTEVVPVLLIGKFLGKPVIMSYRRNQAEVELERSARLMVPFLRLCDRVVVPVRYLADLLAGHGVDAEVVPLTVSGLKSKAREIKSVQPKIIAARSLVKRNNVARIIEGFGIVKQKYPRAELVIAGDGPERGRLQQLITDEGLTGITLAGAQTPHEVAVLFDESDLYINASTVDGLPASLVAALAVGLPVVTTGVGGIAELVTDRVNALLVRSDSPAEVAERVIELIESPGLVGSLSRNAYATYCRYSQDQSAADVSSARSDVPR